MMTYEFSYEIRPNGADRCIIALKGDIDYGNYSELTKALDDAIDTGYRFVKLDLSEVDNILSCAYGAMIDAMITLENRGGSMSFSNPGRQAAKVLKLLNLMSDSRKTSA